ncbi:unnamed protein product [Spirodela intermedia]|uniref:Uncharacterized protein n=1 Tax=Spirodela intermedia TaxID=51605 RepID=A0A7I8LCF1_SPIIN|nr:unnamed protein product [Spirodela intermedia]
MCIMLSCVFCVFVCHTLWKLQCAFSFDIILELNCI